MPIAIVIKTGLMTSQSQVVESMCELMLTMGESEELAAELASYPVVKMLQKAIAEFPCIEDIVQVCRVF